MSWGGGEGLNRPNMKMANKCWTPFKITKPKPLVAPFDSFEQHVTRFYSICLVELQAEVSLYNIDMIFN